MGLPNSIPGMRENLGNPNTVGLVQVLNLIESVLIQEEPNPEHFNRPAYALYARLYELGLTGNKLVAFHQECGGDILEMRSRLGLTVWQLGA